MDQGAVRAAGRMVAHFRALDAEIGAVAMAILLVVAEAGEIGMKDIAQRVGVVKSSVSRTVALMSRTGHKGANGHDLLAWREDPADRRNKRVFLTRKGQDFMRQLTGLLVVDTAEAGAAETMPAPILAVAAVPLNGHASH
ncbi:hypothetical protein HHL28_04535 [Aerophototrophica crusticola]|uniref:HTH marR-type domain-containing protein n=1 Tax=Aerophototrophica crusticola TaxID=1709002 RepID=A0A858R500_9PROT|nr:hypothetical protein HHL28_04535 [Rhodospirillaceae bacterium B3]